jgi:hypothetical protein
VGIFATAKMQPNPINLPRRNREAGLLSPAACSPLHVVRAHPVWAATEPPIAGRLVNSGSLIDYRGHPATDTCAPCSFI